MPHSNILLAYNRTRLEGNITNFSNHCHDGVSQSLVLASNSLCVCVCVCLKHDTLNDLYISLCILDQANAYQCPIVCSCWCVFTRSNTALDTIVCRCIVQLHVGYSNIMWPLTTKTNACTQWMEFDVSSFEVESSILNLDMQTSARVSPGVLGVWRSSLKTSSLTLPLPPVSLTSPPSLKCMLQIYTVTTLYSLR